MDRFIVGTGRCGSTLLSRMLAEHPAVLSLFELFNGLDAARRFSPEPMSGEDFAALIAAEQPFLTAVLRRGYEVPEVIYPFGAGSRYRPGDPMPWILVGVLPRLCADPDRLFDELMAFAAALPRQPPARHYRRLFQWLAARRGRPAWIERSGSSIEYLGSLHALFPEARFLHLHRDGREVALSMREHHAYRLPISLLYGAPTDEGVPASQLGPLDFAAAPRPDDPISRILASRPPAEYFGRYWSDQVLRGLGAAEALAPGRYLALRFEELLAEPGAALGAIGAFFELEPPDGDWTRRAAALVRGAPPRRFEALPPDEGERLARACAPGLRRLGRIP